MGENKTKKWWHVFVKEQKYNKHGIKQTHTLVAERHLNKCVVSQVDRARYTAGLSRAGGVIHRS